MAESVVGCNRPGRAGFSDTRAADTADFSGRWTSKPSPRRRPRPQPALPRGDMGSGWGSPITITQDARQLVVEQALFSRYDLQPPVRSVFRSMDPNRATR